MTFGEIVLTVYVLCLLFGGYSYVQEKWPGALQLWIGVFVFSTVADALFDWPSAVTFGLWASTIGGGLTILAALAVDFVKACEAQEAKDLAAASSAKEPEPQPTVELELTLAEMDPNFNGNKD